MTTEYRQVEGDERGNLILEIGTGTGGHRINVYEKTDKGPVYLGRWVGSLDDFEEIVNDFRWLFARYGGGL